MVGAALTSSPALAGDQADGELFATVFVAGCVAAALHAGDAAATPDPRCAASRYERDDGRNRNDQRSARGIGVDEDDVGLMGHD